MCFPNQTAYASQENALGKKRFNQEEERQLGDPFQTPAPLKETDEATDPQEEEPIEAESQIGQKFVSQATKPLKGARQTASEGSVVPGRVFGGGGIRVMR